jgi:hypothetical protein
MASTRVNGLAFAVGVLACAFWASVLLAAILDPAPLIAYLDRPPWPWGTIGILVLGMWLPLMLRDHSARLLSTHWGAVSRWLPRISLIFWSPILLVLLFMVFGTAGLNSPEAKVAATRLFPFIFLVNWLVPTVIIARYGLLRSPA